MKTNKKLYKEVKFILDKNLMLDMPHPVKAIRDTTKEILALIEQECKKERIAQSNWDWQLRNHNNL